MRHRSPHKRTQIGLAKLPASGNDTEPVDHDRQIMHLGILLEGRIRHQFAHTIFMSVLVGLANPVGYGKVVPSAEDCFPSESERKTDN
jgi:hypothetical protein